MLETEKKNGPGTKIERNDLIDRGWRMFGLPPKELSQQIFEKDGKQIVWDAITREIVKGFLD